MEAKGSFVLRLYGYSLRVVEPEAIYKTYVLLKHLKEEYQGNFASDAMLYMERVWKHLCGKIRLNFMHK